jgi:hypothetical protein
MRRLSSVVLAAVGAAAVGCRPHPSPPKLGSTQPMAIGVEVALAPALGTPTFNFTVSSGRAYEGRASVLTQKPPGPPASFLSRRRFAGRVVLRTSLVLDARTVVPVDGAPFQDVSVHLPTNQSRSDLRFTLPPLEAGHHCLVVAAIEDARVIFNPGRRTVDHTTAAAVGIDAGPGPEHCAAATLHSGDVAKADLPLDCDEPLLSPVPTVARRGGRLPAGSRLWAEVTARGCRQPSGATVMFFRDGRLVLTPGPQQPVSIPLDFQVRVLPLGPVESGSWRVVQATVLPARVMARICPPVLVQ